MNLLVFASSTGYRDALNFSADSLKPLVEAKDGR